MDDRKLVNKASELLAALEPLQPQSEQPTAEELSRYAKYRHYATNPPHMSGVMTFKQWQECDKHLEALFTEYLGPNYDAPEGKA
jgi:hypothetical protein